jgi:hypothetical protein
MKFTFKEKIYKTGVNWCVDVPTEISGQLKIKKGLIDIKGKINGFDFIKTLVPVKNGPHRLFVNLIMMKGGKTSVGETAVFEIEENKEKIIREYPMPEILEAHLSKHNLTDRFEKLTPSVKKDILKYLNTVKREETLQSNLNNLILQLKNNEKRVRIPRSDYLKSNYNKE